MAYTVIGPQGAVTYEGDGANRIEGTQQHSGSFAMQNLPYCINVITASSAQTFLLPGAYVLSSSSGAVTATVPDPGRVPGGKFIFRCGSAHAHLITGSVPGHTSFSITPGITATGARGTRIALENVQNSSVVLESDGFRYLVSACSGTITIAQN